MTLKQLHTYDSVFYMSIVNLSLFWNILVIFIFKYISKYINCVGQYFMFTSCPSWIICPRIFLQCNFFVLSIFGSMVVLKKNSLAEDICPRIFFVRACTLGYFVRWLPSLDISFCGYNILWNICPVDIFSGYFVVWTFLRICLVCATLVMSSCP